MAVPPQNPVDCTIVDVCAFGVEPTYPRCSPCCTPCPQSPEQSAGRSSIALWYLTPLMPPATPEHFGDYELVERLGVGGMAETFLAIRRGPGAFEQRVCLKRILPTFADDADFVEMFLREARMSALLHHGHIARVLDFGITGGAHYLTLELIEGTDLRAALRHLRRRGESLDPGLTSYVAHALASALDFAHTADENGVAAGIIHRDVSPANVLLSNAGEIKLADFGIAKATSLPGSIQSGALKGKVPYMN